MVWFFVSFSWLFWPWQKTTLSCCLCDLQLQVSVPCWWWKSKCCLRSPDVTIYHWLYIKENADPDIDISELMTSELISHRQQKSVYIFQNRCDSGNLLMTPPINVQDYCCSLFQNCIYQILVLLHPISYDGCYVSSPFAIDIGHPCNKC